MLWTCCSAAEMAAPELTLGWTITSHQQQDNDHKCTAKMTARLGRFNETHLTVAGVTQFQSGWECVVGLAHQPIHFEGGGTVVPWGPGKSPTDWMWQTHRDASEVTCSYISLQKAALQTIDFMEVSKYVLKSFLLFWPICLKYTHTHTRARIFARQHRMT